MVHTANLRHNAVLQKGEEYVNVPDVCGPSWWKILHNTADAIRTDGCPTCGEEAVSLMQYMHDLVNVKLDKKPFKPEEESRWFTQAEKLHEAVSVHARQKKTTKRSCPLDVVTAKETPSDMKKYLAIMSKSIYKKDYGQFVKEVNSLCNTKQLTFNQEGPVMDRADTEVKITGKCKVPGESCTYKVYGGGKSLLKTPKVETKVSSLGEIDSAIEQVRDELSQVKRTDAFTVDETETPKTTAGGKAIDSWTIDEAGAVTATTFAIGQNDTTKYELKWKLEKIWDMSGIDVRRNVKSESEEGRHKMVADKVTRDHVCNYNEIQTSQIFGTMAKNPCYPKILQPRDRERASSQLQIQNMAQTLDADTLLTDFHSLDKGAPIINQDGFVLSGNGRVLAIMRSASERSATTTQGKKIFEKYENYLKQIEQRGMGGEFGPELLDKFKLDPKLVEKTKALGATQGEYKAPVVYVLTREIDTHNWTEQQLIDFVQEANSAGTLAQSSLENAVSDARRISPSEFRNLADRQESQDKSLSEILKTTAGIGFVTRFYNELPQFEQAQYFMADGSLNQEGIKRVEMAIYVYVFGEEQGSKLAEMKFESLDEFIQNIFKAIDKSIFYLALVRSKIQEKAIAENLDLSVDLSQSINVYVSIKKTPGQSVEMFLAQDSFLEKQLTPFQETLLKLIDQNSRRPKVLANIWSAWARRILSTPDPGQSRMIIGQSEPGRPTLESTYEEGLSIAEAKLDIDKVAGTQPGVLVMGQDRNQIIDQMMKEFEHKAYDSFSRYKFLMGGYNSAKWVMLNELKGRLGEKKSPSPFKPIVTLAKTNIGQFKAKQFMESIA